MGDDWAAWQSPQAAPPLSRPAPDLPSGPWQLLSDKDPFRSQQLRLLFLCAGADFEDRRLSDAEVEACKGQAAGDASPLLFDILPAVVHGSHVVSTVAGAMQYVGESLDLGGQPGAPRCKALMIVIGCEAMRNEVFYPAYEKTMETRSRLPAFPMEGYTKWFGHFERYLRVSADGVENVGTEAGPYVLGERLCYADLALYDCCTAIIDLGCFGRDEADRASKFPRLCALLDAVAAHPRLAGYGRPHAEALRALAGELPPPKGPALRGGGGLVWEVVGGGETGGLLVREEKSTASKADGQRLSTGALVKELQLEGERLRYERLTGTGPNTGWVSVAVKGKELLKRTLKRPLNPPMRGRELPDAPAEGAWRVLYYESPGRGQQLRLMFRFTKVAVDDKKLTDEEVQFYKSRFARDTSPLAFDFVPIVQHGSCNICTTAGSLQYIAEELGMGGEGVALRSKMAMLVVVSELMRNQVVYPVYHPMRKQKKRIGFADQGPYHEWFGHFERYFRNAAADAEAVGAEPGPYLFGPKLCYADLVLYDCFTYIIDIEVYGRDEAARASQYPRICAFIEAVGRQPSLADYGRPHAEDLVARCGALPPPRTPEDEPPPAPPALSRRELLRMRLAEVEAAMSKEGAGTGDDSGGKANGNKQLGVEVVIGSSKLMAENPGLVEHLSNLINSSYEASVRDNPVRKGQHKSVPPEEVYGRLSIGDNGTRNNRVLHVAFQGKQAVGCISSSFSTPWTPKGVGHWGLLAVDAAAQGKGVASALVDSAMQRLAQQCDEAHIEYFNTSGDKHSERLKAWYEGKVGFRTVSANPSGPATTFRVCRRNFTAEEQARGRRARLRELREEIAWELGSLDASSGSGEDGLHCSEVFERFVEYVRDKGTELAPHIGAAFQFNVSDAGPEGKFFVDLRPGMCCAWYGEEPTANCTIETTDADLEVWLAQHIDGDHAFWSGRAIVSDPEDRVGALMWIYHEACAHWENTHRAE